MTTATLATGNRTQVVQPRRSLEELVDRLMAALFPAQPETAATPGVARSVHEARRLRQAGNVDGALAVLAGMDAAQATTKEARWAFSEWRQMVRRRFGDRDALVYSLGAGRAAALAPRADGALEVVAVLGLRWKTGKLVSRRSLRSLRPLNGGALEPGLGTLPGDVGGAAVLATLARTRRRLAPA